MLLETLVVILGRPVIDRAMVRVERSLDDLGWIHQDALGRKLTGRCRDEAGVVNFSTT